MQVWDDAPVRSSGISAILNGSISKKLIKCWELEFLSLIQFSTGISRELYATYYFELRSLYTEIMATKADAPKFALKPMTRLDGKLLEKRSDPKRFKFSPVAVASSSSAAASSSLSSSAAVAVGPCPITTAAVGACPITTKSHSLTRSIDASEVSIDISVFDSFSKLKPISSSIASYDEFDYEDDNSYKNSNNNNSYDVHSNRLSSSYSTIKKLSKMPVSSKTSRNPKAADKTVDGDAYMSTSPPPQSFSNWSKTNGGPELKIKKSEKKSKDDCVYTDKSVFTLDFN